ncbi:hypothetical protein [Pseudomonas mosselii]|uniref:hypothetical protein n=1 Tax=Pseudomonas mosselii TaxID=78327 RepID=UPI0027DD79F8|nr:hypothetical protein [Pseudomonas mosselii]
MFLTHQHAKIDEFGVFGADPTAWSYVEHTIHRPWFYVSTSEPADDFDVNPMLMLSNEALLHSLMTDPDHGLKVHSVLLVTPDHVNQTGRWTMEPLELIQRFESRDGIAYAYQVEGAKTYIYGDAEIASQQSARTQTLFNSTMLSAPPG